MSDKLHRLVDAIGAANDERARDLDRTASLRRARFIAAVRRSPPRSRVRWWAAGVAAMAAGAAAVVLLLVMPTPALQFSIDGEPAEAGAMVVAHQQPVLVSFSEGSRMRAEPGARLSVRPHEHGAAIELSAGTVDLSVNKRADARWSVLAGPYEVRVIGTEFSTSWSAQPPRLIVEVREGEVSVRGPDLERSVRSGDRLVLGDSAPALARAPTHPEPDPEPDAETTLPAEASPGPSDEASTSVVPVPPDDGRRGVAPRKPAPAGDPSWAQLASRGDYDAAFEAAAVGGFARRCRRASAAQLGELADIARYAGETNAARDALGLLRERFPRTTGGRQAAYRLGRLEFEQARRYGAAAKWFEVYLHEHPKGALAPAALGRLVESLDRSGREAEARREARRYLERYPDGPHRDIARALQD